MDRRWESPHVVVPPPRYWFESRRADADIRDELQLHREMTRERLGARGATAGEAERESRRALGNTTLAVEDARAVWTSRLADDVIRDTRHAFRLVGRQPGFSALAIVTLAIGIGAVTTVVSILRAEVWRPLPFPQSRRPGLRRRNHDRATGSVREADGRGVRSDSIAVTIVHGSGWLPVEREPRRHRRARRRTRLGRANHHEFLRRPPGRAGGGTDVPARRRARRCRQRGHRELRVLAAVFSGTPDVLQQTVAIDNRPFAIVGVAPAGLRLEFTTDPQMFVPIRDLSRPRGRQHDRAPGRGNGLRGDRSRTRSDRRHHAGPHARARGRHVRARDLTRALARRRGGRTSSSWSRPACCCSRRAPTSRICCSGAASRDGPSFRCARRSAAAAAGWCDNCIVESVCLRVRRRWRDLRWPHSGFGRSSHWRRRRTSRRAARSGSTSTWRSSRSPSRRSPPRSAARCPRGKRPMAICERRSRARPADSAASRASGGCAAVCSPSRSRSPSCCS